MRGRSIQSKITTNKTTLPTAVFIAVVCWVVAYLLIPSHSAVIDRYTFLGLLDGFQLPVWINKLASFVLYFLVGYFLISLNNTFGIIRIRASVQTSFFLVFITVCPALHTLHPGGIGAIMFVLSIYFLFRSYQQQMPSRHLFISFLFLGLGSLFFPKMTMLVPVLWIGAILFNSFNFRSFVGSFFGWSIPYWFLFGYAYVFDRMDLFWHPFQELIAFSPIDLSKIQLSEQVTLAYFILLFIISAIHCFAESYKDKIRTRLFLRFLIIANIFIYLFILLQPQYYEDLLILSTVGLSILFAHFVVLTNSKASNLFFICSSIGLILLFAFNLWTLL